MHLQYRNELGKFQITCDTLFGDSILIARCVLSEMRCIVEAYCEMRFNITSNNVFDKIGLCRRTLSISIAIRFGCEIPAGGEGTPYKIR